MRIGIIGAGQIGGTLARRLTALGHDVSIANSRVPESLAGLARETGAKPVTGQQAARAGEVVQLCLQAVKSFLGKPSCSCAVGGRHGLLLLMVKQAGQTSKDPATVATYRSQ